MDAGARAATAIADVSAADYTTLRYADAGRVLDLVQVWGRGLAPRGPLVLVVGDRELFYGLARMYQEVAFGLGRVVVVRRIEELENSADQQAGPSTGDNDR